MALEPLVHQAVQKRPAVVTEGGAGVAVGPELVKPSVCTATSVLQQQQPETNVRRKSWFSVRLCQLPCLHQDSERLQTHDIVCGEQSCTLRILTINRKLHKNHSFVYPGTDIPAFRIPWN